MSFIIIAMLFYTAAILFIAAASRNLSSSLAAGLVNLVAAVIPLAFSLTAASRKSAGNHRFGLLMAMLGGVCIAIYAIATAKSYSLNKVGIVAPTVFGGAILLSSILSIFIFKQKMNLTEAIGLAIMTLGLGVIIYARASA